MMQIRKAPKTDAVYSLLKQRIESGAYADGPLPVEPVLAGELQVSRKTLRSALSRLALENLILRVKGEGTFVKRAGGRRKILVVVRNAEDITLPDRYILPGIQQQASEMNIAVETCTCLSLSAGPAGDTVRRIRESDCCGIISLESNFTGDEPLIGILKGTNLPVLLPHAYRQDAERTPFAVMGTDYRQVIRDGLQYLVNLGHRRIAYLGFREHRIGREDYFRLLDELGLAGCRDLYVQAASYNRRPDVMASIDRLFSQPKGEVPSAVLCFSDFFAICLYEYLNARHLRIPEDAAVLSIGGMIGCDFLSPPLSALSFDCTEIGRLAVRTLLEMGMKNEQSRPFTVTPHYLSERESTRKPSGKEPRK